MRIRKDYTRYGAVNFEMKIRSVTQNKYGIMSTVKGELIHFGSQSVKFDHTARDIQ